MKEGKTVYIIPVVGKGLWGPIWGNICVGEDRQTIVGASFGHKTENLAVLWPIFGAS